MQNSTQKATFERGFFRRAFQEFDEQTFFSNLQKRLQEQPYYRKNRGLKNVLLSLSYALNVISALSASYLIYWLTETLTGFTIVAYIVAGGFLFFLEKLKRKSSNEFFRVYFFDKKRIAVGWLILSLFCFGLSVSSTYFGTEQGAKDVASKASTLSVDATEKEIKQEIEKLETENDKYEQQTTKDGTIYFPLQRSIEQNKIMINSLQNRLIKKQEEREEMIKIKKANTSKKINLTATTLAWILVFWN
jgi:amino acid transporter